jgi:hypothetical protein
VHFRRLVGVGVMIAFLATAFVPVAAAQAQAPSTNSNAFSEKSIEKAVADTKVGTDVASLGKREASSLRNDDAAKAQAQATKTGSFFKTRTGVLVLVVMAAGTGYALRSVSKDRIHSSAR